MATKIAEAFIELKARTDKVEADLRRLEQQSRRATARIEGNFRNVTGLISRFRGLLAGLGIGLVLREFQQLIASSIAFSRALVNTSNRLGLTTDELQELRFAARQSGLTIQAFDVGFQRFTRRLAEARRGTGVLRDVFNELNIDIAAGRRNVDVFEDFINALVDVEDQAERVRLAFQAFDTEGVGFVQFVRRGRDGLEEFRREARETGQVLDRDVAARFNALGNQIDRITTATANAAREVAQGGFLQGLADGAERLTTGVDQAQIAYRRALEVFADRTPEELEEQLERVNQKLREQIQIRIQQSRVNTQDPSRDALIESLKSERQAIQDLIDSQDDLADARAANERVENIDFIRDLLSVQRQIAIEAGNTAEARRLSAELFARELEVAERSNRLTKEQTDQLREQNALLLERQAAREEVERESQLRAEEDAARQRRVQAFEREEEERERLAEREEERQQRADLRDEARAKRRIDREQRVADARRQAFASSFADLVLEGENAADRLREIFLRRFVEQIGLQIANLFAAAEGGGGLFGSAVGTAARFVGLPAPVAAAVSGGSGSSVEVNVSTLEPMTVSRGQGGVGVDEIIVEPVVASIIGGGRAAQAISQRFGIQRQGTSR